VRRALGIVVVLVCALQILPALAGPVVGVGEAGPDCSPEATSSLAYGCENLQIAVNVDGALLDATLFVPNSATAEDPAPAILMTHGYGGWHRSAGDIASAARLASRGYVVLSFTSRGFGRSEGNVQLQAPEWEVRDAFDLIAWLADPGNTGGRVLLDGPGDPRLGMFGGSYAGGIQLLVAAGDQAGLLDAITPQVTWNDLRYSLAPNGATHHAWIDLLFVSGKYSGHFGPLGSAPPPVVSTDGVPVDQDIQVLTSYVANDNVEMPVAYSDGSTSTYEYLARRSVTNDAAAITAPTLLIQGQHDSLFTVTEALRTFDLISSRDKKLVVFSGGHGYADLEGERAMINDRVDSWFDRHLGEDPETDTGPQIETWRPWVDGANFAAATPAEALAPAALDGPASATLVNLVAPTASSETTNFQQQTNSEAVELLPGVADNWWTTSTAQDTYLFGAPQVRFHLEAAAPEAIVFVRLWDTSEPEWQLIHRLVAPVRARGTSAEFCEGYLPEPLDPAASVDADVCVDLPALTYLVPAGGSLAVTIGTTNVTHMGSRIPGPYDVSDVALELPIVPAF